MKKILFVCGSGGITSTVAENYVKEACAALGMDIKTVRCSPMEIESNLAGMDMIVSTTTLMPVYPIPVVSGLPLLMGIGKDKVIDEIMEICNKDTVN